MVPSLVEFLSKLGTLFIDWIFSYRRKAAEDKKQYDETRDEVSKDAPEAADEQTRTKKLRENDPWLKEKKQ